MSYPVELKEEAIRLRKQGFSIKEIASLLKIAQGTSSVWLSSVELNAGALKRLAERKNLGRLKSADTIRNKKKIIRKELDEKSKKALGEIKFSKNLCKLLCSILFWTEGGKFTDSFVYFINSDPDMVELFMKLMRISFVIEERKFRALVHIHNYHNDAEIKEFWSQKTNLPLSQFNKSYLKNNTQKRIREGYMGCIRIRYYDAKIALELRSFYNALVKVI